MTDLRPMEEILKQIGLSRVEVEVYLALLRSGQSSVKQIAEKVKLHRTNIYDTIEKLMEKGLVSFIIQGRTKFYQARDPSSLKEFFDEKSRLLNTILPDLSKLAQINKPKVDIQVLKGRNVIRFILQDIMSKVKPNAEILIFGVDEKKFIDKTDKLTAKLHVQNLKKKDIKEKLLAREGETFFFPGDQSEYRLVPKQYFMTSPTFIYENTTAIVTWGEIDHAVIIDSEICAKNYRNLFFSQWDCAKKVSAKDINKLISKNPKSR